MKKLFSYVAAICLLMNACLLSAHAEAYNIVENSDYIKYDLETGVPSYHSFEDLPDAIGDADYACSPGYFPNGVEPIDANLVSPAAVVGSWDGREAIDSTTVGPYCNTVYIYSHYTHNGSGFCGVGSGFVIGPSAVATGAHCVYHPTYGYPDYIEVVPAKNGPSEPYGQETFSNPVAGEDLIISPAYMQTQNREYDWAIIMLNSQLGNQTGWLGIRWQSESYNDTFVYNTGYPDAVDGYAQPEIERYMFVGMGYVKKSETRGLYGNWDATGGNSGGPVFAYYDNTGYTLIGILTSGSSTQDLEYGDRDDGTCSYSYATRITEDLYNLFVSYRTSS